MTTTKFATPTLTGKEVRETYITSDSATPFAQFIRAYVEAVYFTETGDEGQPPATAELTDGLLVEAYVECYEFFVRYRHLFNEQYEQAGHDFWFTRQGHGVGFWGSGRPYPLDHRRRLTEAAKAWGEVEYRFAYPQPVADTGPTPAPHCPKCGSREWQENATIHRVVRLSDGRVIDSPYGEGYSYSIDCSGCGFGPGPSDADNEWLWDTLSAAFEQLRKAQEVTT